MRKIILLLLFCGLGGADVWAQTGRLNDTIPSWNIGVDAFKLLQTMGSQLVDDSKEVSVYEVKVYRETNKAIRPSLLLGYANYHKTIGEVAFRDTQGLYGKAGAEWVFARPRFGNHALGAHGVMSYIWELNGIRTGNDYFGYKLVEHEYDLWLPAINLSYAYIFYILPRLHAQAAVYVSVYDSNIGENWRLYQMPGVPRALEVSFCFFYRLY